MITLIGFSLLPMMVCCNFVTSHFKWNVPKSDFKFDIPRSNSTNVTKSLSQIDPKSSPGYFGIPQYPVMWCKVKFVLPRSAPRIAAIEWIVESEFEPLLLTR